MKIRRQGPLTVALSLWLGLSGCSSDDAGKSPGAGGSSSSPGGAGGSGANQGTGGQGTGGPGAGGQSTGGQSTGGQNAGGLGTGGKGSGGASGLGGSGGSASGAGGSSAGDGGTGADASPPPQDAGGPFTLMSGAYSEGMTIPAVHTCAGANTSPPLEWTAGPAGTKSYTLILTDKTNMLVHWALWDIPLTPTSLVAALAAGMPAGSHGASLAGNGGYSGPCPSGNLHTYQFDLYAVDVAALPINANSMQAAVVTSVMSHKLAVASLSGTSDARRP